MPPRRRRRGRLSLTEALSHLEANDAAVQRAARRLEEVQDSILWRARSGVERRTFTPSKPNERENDDV